MNRKPYLGIAYYLIAIVFMSAMDASAKWLSKNYPVGQVTFFRSLFAFIPIAFLVWQGGGIKKLTTRRFSMHCWRGLAIVVTVTLFFLGLRYIPLAEATAISLSGPLFMTALSAPLLKEKVTPRRWVAVIVGFIGVLIIIRPGAEAFKPAGLIVMGSGFFYALAAISTRELTRTETNVAIIVYGNIIMTVVSAVTLLFSWVTPLPHDIPVFVFIGLAGGLSTFFFILAFSRAQVSILAPFDYTVLVVSTILGFILWKDFPDLWVWAGAVVIVLSGIYISRTGEQ